MSKRIAKQAARWVDECFMTWSFCFDGMKTSFVPKRRRWEFIASSIANGGPKDSHQQRPWNSNNSRAIMKNLWSGSWQSELFGATLVLACNR